MSLGLVVVALKFSGADTIYDTHDANSVIRCACENHTGGIGGGTVYAAHLGHLQARSTARASHVFLGTRVRIGERLCLHACRPVLCGAPP